MEKRETNFIFTLIVILFTLISFDNLAQDIIEEINEESTAEYYDSESFNETIKLIGQSQKIYVLTNNSEKMLKGDFVTLSVDQKPCARFVVGKNKEQRAGLKILRIYSMKCWQKFRVGRLVQVTRGDDSHLFRDKKEENIPTELADEEKRIETEEDLYSVSDYGDLNEGHRHIKPDNIIGAALSRHQVEDFNGDLFENDKYNMSWAFQFQDNWFFEGVFSSVRLDNFPSKSTQTQLNIYQAKIKYNIKAPLYSFVMPYVGFETTSYSSPDAGNIDDKGIAAKELEVVEQLEYQRIIFGITILRRLVPGWFAKIDAGTDGLAGGFAIEF
jgi:hypothetical protein